MTKVRVLVVDQEPVELQEYGELLVSEGYEVEKAGSAAEAASSIASRPPDLVLMDLPGTGDEKVRAAREITAGGGTARIPIIVVTPISGVTPDADPAAGIRRFIFKPCRPKTLLEGITDVLKYRR